MPESDSVACQVLAATLTMLEGGLGWIQTQQIAAVLNREINVADSLCAASLELLCVFIAATQPQPQASCSLLAACVMTKPQNLSEIACTHCLCLTVQL